jgi:hypothetical protein
MTRGKRYHKLTYDEYGELMRRAGPIYAAAGKGEDGWKAIRKWVRDEIRVQYGDTQSQSLLDRIARCGIKPKDNYMDYWLENNGEAYNG